MIAYSAPGKVILSGEHSVVYTKPAFVTAINLVLTFRVRKKTKSEEVIKSKEIIYCETVIKKYLQKNNISWNDTPYYFEIDSQILEGRGMGSSAAFCVAVVAGLLHYFTGQAFEKQIINSLAYQCEKYFHGMPSGVDVSASCFGGLIFYRKEFEFLKNISALNFKIPKKIQDRLILIDTGKPIESTEDMLKIVGKRYNAYSKKMESTFAQIERMTKRMVVSTVKEDVKMFSDAIAKNQRLLVDLGIVSKKTSQLLEKLKPYGVGKVTGAGGAKMGSGMVLFCMKDNTNIKQLLLSEGFSLIPFQQDQNGLQHIES